MRAGKFAHKLFREQPVGVLTNVAQDINPNSSTSSRGRSPRGIRHFRLDFKDTNHWPAKGPSRRRNVRSSQGKISRSFYFCEDYGVGLCLSVPTTGSHKTPLLSVYRGAKLTRNNGALKCATLTAYGRVWKVSRKKSDSYPSADSIEISVLCYGKVKFTPEQATKTQRGSRVIALLFL
jgi:hypothetical protein